MMKLRILLSTTHNPWFNLATEDWIFQELGDCDHVLFLWRNQPTVVIGRSQNPWAECNLANMETDGVLLARRQSGGGAVFHDLGNTNFTFLSKKEVYSKQKNLDLICRALKSFKIEAHASGRNDLVVPISATEIRKISGSAFKEKFDRAFHHGTLLINTDLNRLQNYLQPHPKKLQAKGAQSVRARVLNAVELNAQITHELFCSALIAEFLALHQQQNIAIETLSVDALQTIESLNTYYQQMQNWQWLYGQTLPFTHQFVERFNWGLIEVQLVVQQGVVEESKAYSDSLQPDMVDAISQALVGVPYTPAAIGAALERLIQANPAWELELKEFTNWMLSELR